FLNNLHYMIETIWNEQEKFSLLHTLIENRQMMLTSSSEQTFQLLNQGYSIDEIAKIRRLKRSTVEDHLVEITLKDSSFSIDTYVSTDVQRKILDVTYNNKERKLSVIKQRVPEAEYFEIRLVLSKFS